jgi:hypothetical protein
MIGPESWLLETDISMLLLYNKRQWCWSEHNINGPEHWLLETDNAMLSLYNKRQWCGSEHKHEWSWTLTWWSRYRHIIALQVTLMIWIRAEHEWSWTQTWWNRYRFVIALQISTMIQIRAEHEWSWTPTLWNISPCYCFTSNAGDVDLSNTWLAQKTDFLKPISPC